MVCDSNDTTNFSHKLLLTKTQVSRIRIKYPKTQLATRLRLRGSIIDEMLGPFTLFKLIKSIEELNKKRSSYKHKRDRT